MNYAYLGPGPAKDRARELVYAACREYWEHHERPLGDFVVLCGPTPADARELKALGAPPSSCWFVDHKNKDGLAQVAWVMPDAHVFFGDVQCLLQRLEHVAFVNLDLMSNVANVEKLMAQAVKKVKPGGIVALTFVCGREHPDAIQPLLIADMKGRTLEEARWSFLMRKLLKTRRRCKELTRIKYRDNTMAMACVVFAVGWT